MATIDTNCRVDIDVDEFLDACSTREIKEVIRWLIENGDIMEGIGSANDVIFYEHLKKIGSNKFRLSLEQEQIIEQLASLL